MNQCIKKEALDSGTDDQAPLVSVVMPCYNSAAFVSRAIESVLAQTFPHFELLIVDDCSRDDTRGVISRHLEEGRIRYFRHESNSGPSAARNTGVRAARGELVAFLDSDDYWMPQKLERQVRAFSDAEVGVCYVAARREVIGDDGNVEVITLNRTPSSDRDQFYIRLIFNKESVSGSSSSVMARRTCLLEAGLFNESMWTCEDVDLWVRLAARYRFKFISDPLAYIISRPDSNSSDPVRMAKGREGLLRTISADMPYHLRHVLPELRRHHYWRTARLNYKGNALWACRRYCLKVLWHSRRIDGRFKGALRLLVRSTMPSWFRRGMLRPVTPRKPSYASDSQRAASVKKP